VIDSWSKIHTVSRQCASVKSHFDVEHFRILRRLVEGREVQQRRCTAVAIKHPHCKRRSSREDLTQTTQTSQCSVFDVMSQ